MAAIEGESYRVACAVESVVAAAFFVFVIENVSAFGDEVLDHVKLVHAGVLDEALPVLRMQGASSGHRAGERMGLPDMARERCLPGGLPPCLRPFVLQFAVFSPFRFGAVLCPSYLPCLRLCQRRLATECLLLEPWQRPGTPSRATIRVDTKASGGRGCHR